MRSRTFASVLPRQPSSSLILSSINAEADSIETALFMNSSSFVLKFSCARRWAQRPQVLGRVFRKQPPNPVAFPHPQSGKDHHRNEKIPSRPGIVWNLFKRTINIADDRNAKDNVNPAKNPTFGALLQNWLLHGFAILLFQLRVVSTNPEPGFTIFDPPE